MLMVLCLGFAAGFVLVLGARIQLPLWIRWEAVIALWWFVWICWLTWLLYSGTRVSHDHAMGAPRNWFAGLWRKDSERSSRASSNWGSWGGDIGVVDGEGCVYLLGILLAIIVAIIALWFLIEIAIPALAFLLYFLIRGMLARVANDLHGCRASVVRSLYWGAAWATLYTAPLAVLVWGFHMAVRRE